jgi:hypothetical protein
MRRVAWDGSKRWLSSRLGRSVTAAVFGIAFAGRLVLPIGTAEAIYEPTKLVRGTFPWHGWLWLDDIRSGSTSLWVYSDRCKSAEPSTWSTINSQLAGGAPEFRGGWPGGIDFIRAACTSSVDIYTDIMLDYMTSSQWSSYSDHGNFGGHHHWTVADSTWCQTMSARYPCGYHISRIHINEPRFDGYSSTSKIWFLMHETGHSMGFHDYCGDLSIGNNGLYCPLRGRYYSNDKKALRDVVYKNSPIY